MDHALHCITVPTLGTFASLTASIDFDVIVFNSFRYLLDEQLLKANRPLLQLRAHRLALHSPRPTSLLPSQSLSVSMEKRPRCPKKQNGGGGCAMVNVDARARSGSTAVEVVL